MGRNAPTTATAPLSPRRCRPATSRRSPIGRSPRCRVASGAGRTGPGTGAANRDHPARRADCRTRPRPPGSGDVLARAPAAEQGTAVVVVLHDLALAAAYADRIVVLENGRVAADGPPADVLSEELADPGVRASRRGHRAPGDRCDPRSPAPRSPTRCVIDPSPSMTAPSRRLRPSHARSSRPPATADTESGSRHGISHDGDDAAFIGQVDLADRPPRRCHDVVRGRYLGFDVGAVDLDVHRALAHPECVELPSAVRPKPCACGPTEMSSTVNVFHSGISTVFSSMTWAGGRKTAGRGVDAPHGIASEPARHRPNSWAFRGSGMLVDSCAGVGR